MVAIQHGLKFSGRRFEQQYSMLAWGLLIVGVTVVAVVAYSLLSRKLVNQDPFFFGLSAKRLLAGHRLYVDFFESKPPLPTLFYAIPGFFWPGSYLAICLLLPAVLLAQASLWLSVLRPRFPAAAACLVFVMLYPATFWDFRWTSSEHFANLFVTVVLLMSYLIVSDHRLSWWRCALAGVAVCLAFHCRQNTVLCGMVPLLAVLAGPATMRAKAVAVLWLGVGALVAWTAILGLVWMIADFHSYFYQTFVFPRRFAEVGGNGKRYLLMADMGDKSLPALLGLSVGLGMFSPYRRLILIALPIGIVSCVLSPRVHYHYWASLIPFITLALLLGLAACTRQVQRVALTVIGVCIAAGLLPLISHAMVVPDMRPMDQVAAWIDEHAHQGDTLYVFGPEYLQFRSQLLPANKYMCSWEIDANDGMMEDDFETILRSYLSRPPTFFVIQDQKMLLIEAARATRNAISPSVRLGVELLERCPYDRVNTVNEHHIYKLHAADGQRRS